MERLCLDQCGFRVQFRYLCWSDDGFRRGDDGIYRSEFDLCCFDRRWC